MARCLACPTNQQGAENVGRWALGPITLFYFSVLDWGSVAFLQLRLGEQQQAVTNQLALLLHLSAPTSGRRRFGRVNIIQFPRAVHSVKLHPHLYLIVPRSTVTDSSMTWSKSDPI